MNDARAQLTAAEIRAACRCGQAGCECQTADGLVHCPAHADSKPSLSVDQGNGKALFKCHSGCAQEAVLSALLGVPGPLPTKRSKSASKRTGGGSAFDYQGATVYEYRDEAGELLFQVLRNGNGAGKQFKQRRPDGKGGWLYSLDGVPLTLYRLDEVRAANTVLVCEGEKAVETLRAALDADGLLGEFCATCNARGGGKWRFEYARELSGKAVYIFPDNDQTGHDHAQEIVRSVAPLARETRVVELPDRAPKAGADDWLNAGNSISRLLELAETTLEAVQLPAPNNGSARFTAPEAAPRPRFVIESAQIVRAFRTPAALVYGVLYENSAAQLAGAAASFKSGIALGMAEAIAGGHKWQGRETKQVPVLYVSGEGKAGLGKRIQALEVFHARPCRIQFLTEAVQVHQPGDVEALLTAIALLAQVPGLVVIDTLARCFVGGDENSARDAGLFIAGVDRIRAATGAAVLVLHHFNKVGDARGSTAFEGAFDTVMETKREEERVTLRCRKQKDAEEFQALNLACRVIEFEERDENGRNLTSLVFETTEAPPPPVPKADATREAVFAGLQAAPDGLTATQWHQASGLSESRFYVHRDALVKAERAVKTGRVYRATSVTPFTPFTPFSEKTEPEINSFYSSLPLGREEKEFGLEEQSSFLELEELPDKPNSYGQD